MAGHEVMIALGAPHKGEPAHDEPDGDEPEGELGDHEYEADAQDVLDAIAAKDANKLAHALEYFVKKCM